MKFVVSLSLVLACLGLCPAAEPPSDQVITAGQAELAAASKAVSEKSAATADAITKVSKSGELKPSTEAYFRDCLDRIHAQPDASTAMPGRVDLDSIYFPPKFDASEEMEPINLAFDDLRQAVKRLQEVTSHVTQESYAAASDAILAAVRTAQKPEDLDAIDRLIAACRKLPDPAMSRMAAFSGNLSASDLLLKIAGAMRAALEAQQQGDFTELVSSLQRVTVNPNYAAFPESRLLSFRTEVVWEQFRGRMAAPLLASAKESQAVVEKSLEDRKPADAINAALADFEVKASRYETIVTDPSRAGAFNQGNQLGVIKNYRAVADALASLDRDDEGQQSNLSLNAAAEGQFSMSPAYRTFVSSLRAEREQRQRKAREAAAEKQQAEIAKTQQRQQAEEMERRVANEKEAAQRVAAVTAAVRAKISSAKSPHELLSLADDLPNLYLLPNDGSFNGDQQQWQLVQAELRDIAAEWLTGAPAPGPAPGEPSNERYPGRYPPNTFITELTQLRDRVLRETVVEHLHLKELQQPAYSEMSTVAALGKLAGEAGEHGDWPRAFELWQAIPQPAADPALASRMKGIRAYLTALNFEQAEEYGKAIAEFDTVLQQTASGIPLRETAAHLKALRASHPEAFKSAEAYPTPKAEALPP